MKKSILKFNYTKKGTILFLSSLILVAACKKEAIETAETGSNKTAAKTSIGTTPGYDWIAVTNGGTAKRIEVYDTGYQLNNPLALKWYFKPTSGSGFTAAEVAAWGGGTDMRLRNTTVWAGTTQVVAVSDGSFASVYAYTYTSGAPKKWAISGVAGNMHAAELLPDGNIALAGSDGNWVRVYNTSTPTSTNYSPSFTLTQAHGVLWDPSIGKLWVVGTIGTDAVITALDYNKAGTGGSRTNPTLTEDTSRRTTLPNANPHDLSAHYGDNNLLWVTTGGHVWSFNKTTKSFTSAGVDANRVGVKSINNQPAGQIFETAPLAGTCKDYTTNKIDFYDAAGVFTLSRTLTGACFYKARPFHETYQ